MINLVLFQVLIADCFGILEKFCGKIYKTLTSSWTQDL